MEFEDIIKEAARWAGIVKQTAEHIIETSPDKVEEKNKDKQ